MQGIEIKNRWRFQIWRRMLFLVYARFRWPARISDAMPFKAVWVHPAAIARRLPYHALRNTVLPPWVVLTPKHGRFCPIHSAGFVVPGDWHGLTEAFTPKASRLYQTFEERYLRGVKWDETEYFRNAVAAVKQGRRVWNGCSSVEEILSNCTKTDQLKESIERHGVLHTMPPIQVNIGPSGELIRNGEGRHRLLFCLMLKLDKLPVHVVVRHHRWQQIRNAVRAGNIDQEHSYHPDLQDIVTKGEGTSASNA